MTGWNLPPGCSVRDIPGCGDEGPCDVCGNAVDACICPECPKCGAQGDPACYRADGCGLPMMAEQIASKDAAEAAWLEEQRKDAEYEARQQGYPEPPEYG